MSDNAHMKQADSNMAYSDSVYTAHEVKHAALWMNRAHVEATLAVAYEQRTANLIAYFKAIDDTDMSVIEQIQQRLGLGD